jgi:hypothetical protein
MESVRKPNSNRNGEPAAHGYGYYSKSKLVNLWVVSGLRQMGTYVGIPDMEIEGISVASQSFRSGTFSILSNDGKMRKRVRDLVYLTGTSGYPWREARGAPYAPRR